MNTFRLTPLLLRVTTGIVWLCTLALGQATQPTTRPADEMIAINFPENAPLKVLVDYVSQRLDMNILYDEQVAAQKVVIKSPAKIPKDSLLSLLQSVLKIKGLVLVDADTPGWKRIIQSSNLSAVSIPTTQMVGGNEAKTAALTQVFALQYADAQRVDPVIKPFLTQPGGNSISVPEQRLLIVTDLATNIQRISELIKLVDQPKPAIGLEFVPIKNLEASAVAAQATQILTSKVKSQSGAAPATGDTLEISQDPRTNRLVLIGTPERIREAKAVVLLLDVPLELETRMYQMRATSPDRLDRTVRELIGPLASKTQYQSAIVQDSRLLVVTSTPEIHKRLTTLKAELDVPITQEQSPIRLYRLANTTAADVLETIRAIEGTEGAAPTMSGEPKAAKTQPAQPSTEIKPPTIPGATSASAIPQSPYRSDEPRKSADATSESRPMQAVKTSKATITADPNTNSIIVVAAPAEQQVYEQLIRMLDRRRPQVLVECFIATIDTSSNLSLGVEISASDVSINPDKVGRLIFSSFGLSTVNPKTGRLALEPGLGFNGAVLSSDVADIVIRALSTNGSARVISAPRILVNDNATGTLASISEAPFTSVNASTTVATTSFAGYASAGTTITLTPHISSDGNHLQLDYAVALNNFSGQGSKDVPPPRQTNSITSKVTIPDGHTIVVGGLNRRDFSKTVSRVPVLGKIPILEYLFSNRTTTNSASTLFVFIRPIILKDDQFEDLKFLSERDVKASGVPSDYPFSEPLLVE